VFKKIIDGLKERWYCLPKWQRHMGGSAVIVMVLAGIMQKTPYGIDWLVAGGGSLLVGIIKELLEDNTTKTFLIDVGLNL